MPRTLKDYFEAFEKCDWDSIATGNALGVSKRQADHKRLELKSKGYPVPESLYMADRRAYLERKGGGQKQDDDHEPVRGVDRVRSFLHHKPATLAEVADACQITKGQALDAIEALKEQGLNLFDHSGTWHWDKVPAPGHTRTDTPSFDSDERGWLRFGFASDAHLCSKYARNDVLNDLYDKFAAEGITKVLNGGNWIDGEASFNQHDLLVHGVHQQLKYLAANFPQRPGMTTYAVAGDDHEGWYAQRAGMDIGRMAQNAMQDAGRSDWVNMGYMECFARMARPHHESGVMLHLVHAGGGSAYATSYTVQKMVEGYDGGEKPAALFVGHYHKLLYALIRNVHTVQMGCTQDQTPFARKKKLSFNLGGGIVEIHLNEASNAIDRFRIEIFNYFVRGFYNNRWSHAEDVTHADRGAA